MSTLYVVLAVFAIPLVFLTLFLKTERGMQVKLGSYYIIKDMRSRAFRVLSYRDKVLLVLRLIIAIIIAILIIDPSEAEAPGRKSIMHDPAQQIDVNIAQSRGKAKLVMPGVVLDSFEEDYFFVKSMVNNLSGIRSDLTVVFNPGKTSLSSIKGNLVIIPSEDQNRYVFNRWSNIFYITDVVKMETRIKGEGILVRQYVRPVFVDKSQVSVYSEMKNGEPLAFSFTDGKRKILFLTVGIASFWGDAGVSGYIIDLIKTFDFNISLSSKRTKEKDEAMKDTGKVMKQIPSMALVYTFIIFIMLEAIWFVVGQKFLYKKFALSAIVLFLILMPGSVFAQDFRFIELDYDTSVNESTRLMFYQIKNEIEKRTSIKIEKNFYSKMSIHELGQGKMPALPYLWIVGCKGPGFFSSKVKKALSKFIERGGIVFIITCGSDNDIEFFDDIETFAEELTGKDFNENGIPQLHSKHPLFRSFFLLSGKDFYGVNVSKSTKRTALMVSRGSLKEKILQRDTYALRSGVNILLYMLSGNYKSDQIHTRQILKKLKKRELYK